MPGPGGGSRGGGGFGGGGGHHGGGFGGGGHHGGGFGGGPRGGGGFGGPHGGGFYGRPFHGGWHHRRYYGGGGCLNGLMGMIFVPIVLILMVVMFLFSAVSDTVITVSNGGVVSYSEEAFEDYADVKYAEEFGTSSAYEDNLLLVVLTSEDNSSYYYIAWVGDHIATDIIYMMGSNGTELGQAMAACINTSSYKYSLDSNLAQVVQTLQGKIEALGQETSYDCEEDHAQVKSHLTNYTQLPMTAQTVDAALEAFTASTGIPVVIVVDEMEDVFGRTMPAGSIFGIVICAVILVVVIWVIVRSVKRKRSSTDEENYRRDRGYDNY